MSNDEIKQLNNVTMTSQGVGGEGVTNNKAWKYVTFTFDVNGKDRKFTAFLPIPFKDSLQPEQVVLGHAYDLKFNETQKAITKGPDANTGKTYPSRVITGIYTAGTLPMPVAVQQPIVTAPIQQPQTLPQTAIVPPQPVLQAQTPEWDDIAFSTAYQQSPDINISEKTLENFMGSYLKMNPTWIVLKEKLQTLFNTYVHPK